MTDATRSDPVLAQIVDSIVPASAALAAQVGARLDARGAQGTPSAPDGLPLLLRRLAAARHTDRPVLARKRAVVLAADHGLSADADGAGLTRAALARVARGEAAVCAAARAAEISLILVDCGVRGGADAADGAALGGVVDLRLGDGTADIRRGPAMSPAQALASVRTGIALLLSVAEDGADIIALEHLSAGSRAASGAMMAALAGLAPASLGLADRDTIAMALAANRPDPAQPLAVLAAVGGFEIGVMAGVLLAAASIHVPVVLDDHGTAAAALLAARLVPAVSGYLFAAHAGSMPGQQRVLHELDVPVIFQAGRPQGEAVGAVLALPLLEGAARLLD